MQDFGRILIALGALLLVAGGAILLLARTGLPFGRLHLGRLPGDVAHRGKTFSFYFPIATCLLLSALLSLVLYALGRFRR